MKAKSSCCQPISPRRLRGERRVGLALVSRRIAGRIIGFLRFARKKPRVWNLCGLGTERVSPRTSPILAKLGSRRRSPRPAEILGDAARGLGGRAAEALAGEYACGCRQPGPVALLLGRVHVPIQRAPRGPWEALRASPAPSGDHRANSVSWRRSPLAFGSPTRLTPTFCWGRLKQSALGSAHLQSDSADTMLATRPSSAKPARNAGTPAPLLHGDNRWPPKKNPAQRSRDAGPGCPNSLSLAPRVPPGSPQCCANA